MRPVQFFPEGYLELCRKMTVEEILQFLEDFRKLHAPLDRTQSISLKIPENLLTAFRRRCFQDGIPYQKQIKRLMQEWLEE